MRRLMRKLTLLPSSSDRELTMIMPAGRLCSFRTDYHLHDFHLWQRPILIRPLATARRLHQLRSSRQRNHWQLHSRLSERTDRLRLSRQYRRVMYVLQYKHGELDRLLLSRKQCWYKMSGRQVASLLESAATVYDNCIWRADYCYCNPELIEHRRRHGKYQHHKSSWSQWWTDCWHCGWCCSGGAASAWSTDLPGFVHAQAQEGERTEAGTAIPPTQVARATHPTHVISSSKTVSSASSNDITLARGRKDCRHDCTGTTHR